jgi:hypothetical protein
MELDRRRFLRILGATGASAALSPLSAIAIDQDLYSNSRLGFSLYKPRGWYFNSVRDFKRITERQEKDLARPELQRELLEIGGYPILVITKYEDRDEPDRLSPNIQVYAEPITSESPEAYLEACDLGQHWLCRYFENCKVERKMHVSVIGDIPCREYEISFDWVYKNIRRQVRACSVNFMNDAAELSFTFMGMRSEPDACVRDLDIAKQSIRLL